MKVLDNFEFQDDGEEKFLFTMDVKGLYTNIPNADGLAALKFFLDKREDKTLPTDTLVRLAEMVLTKKLYSVQ